MIIYTALNCSNYISAQKKKAEKNFLEAVLDLYKNGGHFSVALNFSTEM